MRTHGDPGWEKYPSYLDEFIHVALPVLHRWSLQPTSFVVGQDVALQKNEAAFQAIAEEGYEIGNHSFSHQPWFHRYDRERIESEIGKTVQLIQRVTGTKPMGFRGPRYS